MAWRHIDHLNLFVLRHYDCFWRLEQFSPSFKFHITSLKMCLELEGHLYHPPQPPTIMWGNYRRGAKNGGAAYLS